jgi:SAM-dependent methyltransferase
MEELKERVVREKAAYETGPVHAESAAFQARFDHVFSCPNTLHAEQHLDMVVAQHARDRDILDYGCFNGWMTPRYLKMKPRSITGIDISELGIEVAVGLWGHTAKFYVGDAHEMPFPDSSFDMVVGRAILHHLDFWLALQEIRRVLRPRGWAVFVEPLRDNPGARWLRALTPRARTRDERPLTRSQIVQADSFFGGSSHLFYNLVSVPAAMMTSMTPLKPDNLLLRSCDMVDRALARTPLKYWMRQVILCWRKA